MDMSHLLLCFVALVIQGVVCIYITYNLYSICATKWPRGALYDTEKIVCKGGGKTVKGVHYMTPLW